MPRYLCTTAAAEHLGMSPSYLRKLRVTGGGPEYLKFGRAVRYEIAALDAWAAERAATSTADYSGEAA